MKWMSRVKEISIVERDRIGLLAEISYVLGKENINIETINVNVVDDKAVIRIGVMDPDRTGKLLRAHGFNVMSDNALVFVLPNKSGQLYKLTQEFREKNVPIERVSVISSDGENTVVSVHLGHR